MKKRYDSVIDCLHDVMKGIQLYRNVAPAISQKQGLLANQGSPGKFYYYEHPR